MAHAGASLVQLYTVFGYRGVGTPRLLKNELASSLGGSSWQAQIGRDWKGEQMGWDEARFKKDNEAVRREEEGLGELLRQFDEDEGTRRLIEEAEMALGYSKAQRGRTEPRDNALGSQGGSKDGITKGLVEAAPRHPAMEETSSQRAPSRPSLGAPSIEEALESEPVEVDLMPMTVMVADESSVRGVDEEEEWRRAARGGSRRLV